MKRHFQYHWWKYLLAVLLPIIVWYAVFDAACKPKNNERLRVLYIGEALNVQALQEDLTEYLAQMSDQELTEIKVTQTLPDGIPIGELLTARQFEYDLIILASDRMPESAGQNFFSPLSTPILERFSAQTLYSESVEGRPVSYGFAVKENSRFASYLMQQTDCTLLFSTETVNCDALNGKGKRGDDAALCAAEFLLEEWN